MFKFSHHSKGKHSNEEWNAATIKAALDQGKLRNVTTLPGETADVIYGYAPDGTCVGLIIGKNSIVITGFAAPESYWKNV